MSFTVRRAARPADNFVIISNAFLRDATLSIAARGLGAWLLTHSAEFKISAASIQKACGTGRDKTRSLLNELEQAGYLYRERERKSGRLGGIDYAMSDQKGWSGPATENPSLVESGDDSPGTENQALENQALVQPPHKKTPSDKTNPQKSNPPGGDASAAPVTEPALPPAEDGGLFDDAPFRPEPEPAPPRPFSAADVVAAYVDSYREDSGKDPLKSSIKTVGSHAKRLLADGVEQELLLTAARRLGKTMYASLDREVAIMHRGAGASPARGTRRPLGVVHTPEERQEQRDWFAEQRQLQEERRRAEGTSTTFEENAQ